MGSEKLREADRCSWAVLACACLMAAAGLSCGREPEPAEPRVISLSPIAREVMIALGAGEALIAMGSGPADFVVVEDPITAERLREEGSDVIEFAPHDFDDAYRLCELLGRRLGRAAEARAYVRDHSRPLALMSASSFGDPRPRVAVVVGLSPLEVAGGHSFITDLIEIAGAESVTHGNDDPRIPMSVAELLATAPDLVLLTSATPMAEAERRRLRAMFVGARGVAFMTLDPQHFWLRDAVSTAEQMRDLVKPLVREPLPEALP